MDALHIDDRGRLGKSRITVYNLVPYFLDPAIAEAEICRSFDLTSEQVAAARAYVMEHAEEVMAQHRRIEERIAQGNPPGILDRPEQLHAKFQQYRDWMTERDRAVSAGRGHSFPAFREWLAERSTVAVGKP